MPFDWNLLQGTIVKIFFAWVLSLPTGYITEREGHTAGVRTFPIVGMASCAFLLIMQTQPGDGAASSRALQGLIAGIGFVGGGAILRDGNSVHGTATAASILNTAAIGASVAMGHGEIGLVLALLNLFTMKVLARLKKRLDTDEAGPK